MSEPAFELGDRVLILGGRYDNLRGRVYYIDESLIRILPDGVSDRLVDLPIIETEEGYDLDPELKVESLYVLDKRAKPAFVTQIDAQVDQEAETFGANGEPGAKFTIKAINETADTIVLEDETGAPIEIDFQFRGIPLDEQFAVLRPRQAPDIDNGADNADNADNQNNANEDQDVEEEEENPFEDLLESELEAARPAANSGIAYIQEIAPTDRIYPDMVQRADMLQDLLGAYDAISQKSPEIQKQVRILVEQCMLLRNSLVLYSRTGEPIGQTSTSFLTLAELLATGKVPLSRPVIEAKRALYLDHSPEHFESVKQGNGPRDPVDAPGANVILRYLSDVVNETVAYMDTQLGGIRSAVTAPDALPNWFVSWETLNRQYQMTWAPSGSGDATQFQEDKEFLRSPIPDFTTPQVDGFGVLGANEVDAGARADLVKKLPYSLLRGLGPRYTRLSQKELPRRIESAEEGTIINTLLFPLSEQGYFGSIRSGQLAKVIALSHGATQTFEQTMERLDGIPDVATAGGILSVGPEGNTQGNIPVEDFLQALPIYPLGLADVLVDLANYGLSQTEFTVDQQDVLIAKIDTYRALIKQYITELRDVSAKAISQLVSEQNPFLTGEAVADVLQVLEGEPLLAERIQELKKRIPSYKENDIAIMAGLMETSSDLVLKTLAQVPGPLAIERNRKVRDQFLSALRDAAAAAMKSLNAGDDPVPNDCRHVNDYNIIKKVKDDTARMQLFAKFLTKYRGKREENWINCSVCSEHLVCYHEVLLLQEFLHPREKDTIHKELLLTFSGGQFHGRYMCSNCGQTISNLEFDTSLEFSDSGAPLMGRGVLENPGEGEDDQIDQLLGTPAGVEDEIEYKTETQTLVYRSARRIFDMVGIYATPTAYKNIVQRVESEIIRQPSRGDYAKLTKGKRAVDYDILINRILVGATAVNCLIEIQTNIPGYNVRSKMPGCRAGFTGYPMGAEKDRLGMEYIACAVAAIREDEAPWNLTGFQRESSEKKRQEIVIITMNRLMDVLLTNANVQQQISLKRAYLKDLYGSAAYAEQLPEQIPPRFTPIPYVITDEEATKNIVVPEAATPDQAVRAWIQQAHRISKENGIFIKGNPYSEATCCLKPIQEPGVFWKEKTTLATLPLKNPPVGPVRSHLGVHFKPRPLSRLEATISPETVYKIFLNVCYQGPNMGLPHAPGYTNECIHCGFVFPESPYVQRSIPPLTNELMKSYKEEVESIITKGKVALETQKINTSLKAFEEVVDASHRAFLVKMPAVVPPLAGMVLFEKFRVLTPAPFEGWKEVITETMDRLSKLTPNPDEIEVAEAYGPISNLATEILDEFKTRLGEANALSLKETLESSPSQVVESISAYFLIPFQRLSVGFATRSLHLARGAFELSDLTRDDMNRIISTHFDFMATLTKRATGFTLEKLKWARNRLTDSLKLLKTSIRGSYIPGGSLGLPYVITALIGGILAEFINPNIVPPESADSVAATLVDTNARGPVQILDVCVQKLRQEGLNFNEEQIREMISRRDEIEKKSFISRFERLTPEEKASMKMNKKLGLKEWSVGGTKKIYAYDPEQYETERLQRLEMGFQEFIPGAINIEGEGGEDGYDNAQIAEDDY